MGSMLCASIRTKMIKIFEDENIKIFIYKQKVTYVASNAEWNVFEKCFKDVSNGKIFPYMQISLKVSLFNKLEELFLEDK